jgi:hypothetical protein
MPPAALLPIMIGGIAAGAVGSGLSQAAANKGARPVFPGLTNQALPILSQLGTSSSGALSSAITNPGALPDVSGTVNPAFQALYNANKQFVQQGRANLAEKFGSTGLSVSSPYAVASSNYETQSNADFMNILANYTLQAQEYAANRQLTAATTAFQDFLSPALTLQGPKGSVAGAALGSASSGLETLALIRALGGFGGGSSKSG